MLSRFAPRAAAAVAVVSSLFWSVSTASADLVVPDSFMDRIMRFSSVDGSPIDMNFIPNSATGGLFQLAIEAQGVGDEIWVSDQNADSIFRFTRTGTFLGTKVGPANGLDNIRGFGVINNVLYVTNFFSGNGAPLSFGFYYYAINPRNSPGWSVIGGVDNWSVTIVPEPACGMLLTVALVRCLLARAPRPRW